jgi:hypothetical protein
LVLLAVLQDILDEESAGAFVVDGLEKLCDFVAVRLVLAPVQPLLELLVLLVGCPLVFGLAQFRQILVEFPLELVFEDFYVVDLVDVLFEDVFHFYQFALVTSYLHWGVDCIDDECEVLFGEEELLLEFVVVALDSFVELSGHA